MRVLHRHKKVYCYTCTVIVHEKHPSITSAVIVGVMVSNTSDSVKSYKLKMANINTITPLYYYYITGQDSVSDTQTKQLQV